MKPQRMSKKLLFKKQTISTLDSQVMNGLVAGLMPPAETMVDCPTGDCTAWEVCVATFQVTRCSYDPVSCAVSGYGYTCVC